ncbi:hypothetical protein LINPERPRIM_LOCUS30737, partial [Linum perenne]
RLQSGGPHPGRSGQGHPPTFNGSVSLLWAVETKLASRHQSCLPRGKTRQRGLPCNLSYSRSFGLHLMSCLDNGLSRFLLYDSLGVFVPHLILINNYGASTSFFTKTTTKYLCSKLF